MLAGELTVSTRLHFTCRTAAPLVAYRTVLFLAGVATETVLTLQAETLFALVALECAVITGPNVADPASDPLVAYRTVLSVAGVATETVLTLQAETLFALVALEYLETVIAGPTVADPATVYFEHGLFFDTIQAEGRAAAVTLRRCLALRAEIFIAAFTVEVFLAIAAKSLVALSTVEHVVQALRAH
jgi:hypothetical protein